LWIQNNFRKLSKAAETGRDDGEQGTRALVLNR
jgi:hypothetical protein